MNWLPSELSPRMATKTVPGLTRRESYSTLLTPGSPLCARISAPSSNCWKVIVGNYMAQEPQEAPQGAIEIGHCDMPGGALRRELYDHNHIVLRLPRARSSFSRPALDYFYVHRNQSLQVPLRPVRNAGISMRMRKVLLSLPVRNGHPHLQ